MYVIALISILKPVRHRVMEGWRSHCAQLSIYSSKQNCSTLFSHFIPPQADADQLHRTTPKATASFSTVQISAYRLAILIMVTICISRSLPNTIMPYVEKNLRRRHHLAIHAHDKIEDIDLPQRASSLTASASDDGCGRG